MDSEHSFRALDNLTVVDEVDHEIVGWLDDRLYEFNAAATGFHDGRLLAILLRADDGEVIAGLYGWTWGGTCDVRTLWVREDWRHKQLGSRLLRAAEQEARARGAKQMVLETHSFQAPDFYRRHGFERLGAVSDYPRGYDKIYLRKLL